MKLLLCSALVLAAVAVSQAYPYVLMEVQPAPVESPLVRLVRSAEPQFGGYGGHRQYGHRPGHGGYRPGGGHYGGGGGYRPGGGGISSSASNAFASSQSFNAGGFGGGLSGSAANAGASSQSFNQGGFHG